MSTPNNQALEPYNENIKGAWCDYNVATLVSYSALLTSLETGRERYGLSEALANNTTPTRWLTLKLLQTLSDHKLISIDPHLFTPNPKVVLHQTNDDEHLRSVFNELKLRQVDYMDKSLLSLMRDFLKADLHTQISKQLNKVGVQIISEESDFETFATALERRSLAELYMIVWQTTQNLSAANIRFYSLSESPGGIAGQIESSFLETLNRYENKSIKPFQLKITKRSQLSLVLFNSVLSIKEGYFTKSLAQIWNEYA